MGKELFIKTKDKGVAEQLISLGYVLLQDTNNEFVFLNDSRIVFDKQSQKQIICTDKLCV